MSASVLVAVFPSHALHRRGRGEVLKAATVSHSCQNEGKWTASVLLYCTYDCVLCHTYEYAAWVYAFGDCLVELFRSKTKDARRLGQFLVSQGAKAVRSW
jgi:hypothetical protein